MNRPNESAIEHGAHPHDVPLRMELTFVLPGTAEQVWDAIATANGISSWMLPTDLDPRVGGAVSFHMGEGSSSEGIVTGFDAPHRFAYIEPDWATLAGHDADSVEPLATEFLIEAQSGGTCVLRVVSSAFGTGAEWEREFFTEMERAWTPQFDNLRVYLEHFPGRRVIPMEIEAQVPIPAAALWPALRAAVGASRVGETLQLRDLTCVVERINGAPGPDELLVRTTAPIEGYLNVMAWPTAETTSTAMIAGRFFDDDAPSYIARERDHWKQWLDRAVESPARESGNSAA